MVQRLFEARRFLEELRYMILRLHFNQLFLQSLFKGSGKNVGDPLSFIIVAVVILNIGWLLLYWLNSISDHKKWQIANLKMVVNKF